MDVLRRWVGMVVAAAAVAVFAPSAAGAIVGVGGVATMSTGGNTSGPAYTGPTPGQAKVANNVAYRAKSVTTVVSVPAGSPPRPSRSRR